MPFKKIGLCEELVQGILATGYTAPTEIQAQAIPAAIEGRDMIGCAQTGTGKTAAFVLPILNRIASSTNKSRKPAPKALIVTPTRELAMQIDKAVKGYGRFMNIRSLAVFGGERIERQTKPLKQGVDIITATPGRLIDLINQKYINLSTIEVFVLDEADRMLDMGFVNDIKKIMEKLPEKKQTLLFSATMSKEVKELTNKFLHNPKMIQIGVQHNPIDTITQHIYPIAQHQKMSLLLYMLQQQQMYSVLIFSRTKRGADRICRKLKKSGITAEAIHSDRTQRSREKALEGFKRGKYQVMVATDIAARGINVEGISHVFNYDVPRFPEDYVHRIGRTGRAEATGDAITFVTEEEMQHIRKIERFIDARFEGEYYEGFEYEERLRLTNPPKQTSGRKKVGSSQRNRRNAQQNAKKSHPKHKSAESKKPFDKSNSKKKFAKKTKPKAKSNGPKPRQDRNSNSASSKFKKTKKKTR